MGEHHLLLPSFHGVLRAEKKGLPLLAALYGPGWGGGRGLGVLTLERGEKGPAVTVPSSIRRARLEVREHWVGIFPEARERGHI